MPLNLRHRLAVKLARFIDHRIDVALGPLHRDNLGPLHDRVTEQEHCTNDHRRRLDELEHSRDGLRHDVGELEGHLRWIRGELDRMQPHIAAQDERIETLREQFSVAPSADSGEMTQARSLIGEVQRQHAQIRARLATISQYEERLRRIEDSPASPAAVGAPE